jgi:hypothetical protein
VLSSISSVVMAVIYLFAQGEVGAAPPSVSAFAEYVGDDLADRFIDQVGDAVDKRVQVGDDDVLTEVSGVRGQERINAGAVQRGHVTPSSVYRGNLGSIGATST